MAGAIEATSEGKTSLHGRRTRGVAARISQLVLVAILLIALAPVVLIGVYTVVPPVSTLMVAHWVLGKRVDRHWVELDEVSPALPVAVLAAEDSRFCTHAGVDWAMIRTVIETADEEGPARGASTIAMQTAKNLFLWPEPAYLRKAVEIPLALMIDLVWSKRRIMEVYLNVAEWGPGTFGAEAAARRHFGKSAAQLTAAEAALLAAALPNPFARVAGRPGPGTRRLAARIAARARIAGDLVECLHLGGG
jgi:monofunctional glycosyltransferase